MHWHFIDRWFTFSCVPVLNIFLSTFSVFFSLSHHTFAENQKRAEPLCTQNLHFSQDGKTWAFYNHLHWFYIKTLYIVIYRVCLLFLLINAEFCNDMAWPEVWKYIVWWIDGEIDREICVYQKKPWLKNLQNRSWFTFVFY